MPSIEGVGGVDVRYALFHLAAQDSNVHHFNGWNAAFSAEVPRHFYGIFLNSGARLLENATFGGIF